MRGEPFRLGEWVIPEGVEINPSIRVMHHREALYADARAFRPERFLEPGAPDTYTWIPFGGGTRRCLGASFAQMEMRIVLEQVLGRAHALRAASPELDDVQFRAITLAPREGVRVVQDAAPAAGLMRLFNNQASGNCWKVRQIAAHLGIALELVELDVVDRSDRPEAIGELNPALRVPTLVLDDGRALPESSAILWYLADGTAFLPADAYDRARVLGWLTFEQYEIEPNLAVMRFWNLFGIEASDEQRELKRGGGTRALAALERGLADRAWLVGGTYSIADIALYGYTHVADEGGFDLGPYPAIRAWLDRVAAQPGHIPITA